MELTYVRAISIVLLGTASFVRSQVPYAAATRLIPKWWSTVSAVSDCSSRDDCSPNECCVRPAGSQHYFCLLLRKQGESCYRTLTIPKQVVYFDLCPCAPGLTCREFYTGWVDAECVPPTDLDDEYTNRSFRTAILQAVRKEHLFRKQDKPSQRRRKKRIRQFKEASMDLLY